MSILPGVQNIGNIAQIFTPDPAKTEVLTLAASGTDTVDVTGWTGCRYVVDDDMVVDCTANGEAAAWRRNYDSRGIGSGVTTLTFSNPGTSSITVRVQGF